MKQLLIFLLSIFVFTTTAFAKIPGAYDIVQPDPSLQLPKEKSLDQVRISEVFSFTCVHCYNLNKEIKAIKKKFGNKVVITEYPIGYNTPFTNRLFYISKSLQKSDKMKDLIFSAVFDSGIRNINDPGILTYLAESNKMGKEFKSMINSPMIIGMEQAGVELAEQYKVHSTPTLIIENTLKTGGNVTNLEIIINALLKEPVK